MKPHGFLCSLSPTLILHKPHRAQSNHPSHSSSAALGARHCANPTQNIIPASKIHRASSVFFTFLLLLTGLFVSGALHSSLPVGTLLSPFPGFLFLSFFYFNFLFKMPPTSPALCVLLSIPPVLFWDCHPCPLDKWEERGEVRPWIGLAHLPLSGCAFSVWLCRGQTQTGAGAL